MFCHSCGAQVNPDLQFCPNCGQPLAPASVLSPSAPWPAPPGIQSRTGRWIGEGWRMVKEDLGAYVVITLIFVLLSGVPLIQGPLIAGFHVFCMKRMLGRRAEFADLFTGFNFFVPTLVASLLISLFVALGTMACIIPGLVVGAALKFTYLFIVDKRMEFWPAMQSSHAVVRNDYFGFTMFMLALVGIDILGFLCCIVGLLVSIPVTVAAITVAYKETVGFDPRTAATL